MILEITLTFIFLLAFVTIAFEEGLKMNKAKSTLFFGTFVWLVLFLAADSFGGIHAIEHSFEENILEIATLWLFLIAAMTFVAYMDKCKFIENLVYKYLPKEITEKKLLLIIGIFTFFFSSVADNLTATLVALTILLALKLDGKKLIKFATFVIFAANAGGVSLITGDVTTLMIFLGGKVEMSKLLWLFIPSFVSLIVLYFLLSKGLNKKLKIAPEGTNGCRINKIDKIISGIFISTILCIILGHVFFHIPPVLMFLFGLSVMLVTGWVHKHKKKEDLQLIEYIRAVEFDALFFFLGVLLLVGMLKEIGVLSKITILYDIVPNYVANFVIGMLSSVVDNIPLTAAMLKSGIVMSPADWLDLTYAVGVGGSLLVIGSAAGVVAMSKVKELTFGIYLKNSLYIFIAYAVGFIGTHLISNLIA